jgi:hypothetical protein
MWGYIKKRPNESPKKERSPKKRERSLKMREKREGAMLLSFFHTCASK